MTGLRPCSWVCSPRDCLGKVLTGSGHLCLLEAVSANLNSALSSALLGLPESTILSILASICLDPLRCRGARL